MAVRLAFGFCAERPFGDWADSPKGPGMRRKNLRSVEGINNMMEGLEVPRTFFILGDYLRRCTGEYSTGELKDIFMTRSGLVEIQQHSYSHPIFRAIERRPDRVPITPDEFRKDLQKAQETISEIFGIEPTGIMTPLGYHNDLSDVPDVLAVVGGMGFRYVSSNLSGPDSLNAPFSMDRQTHTYKERGFPRLVEIPTHGWQDSAFTEEGRKRDGLRHYSPDDIFKHYASILEEAEMAEGDACVSLCLHPWAIREYGLSPHAALIDFARRRGIAIVSYGDIARDTLAKDL